MTRSALFVGCALCLLGCGREPDCAVGGLSFFAERPVDCAVVGRNASLALELVGLERAEAVVRIRPELFWERQGPAFGEYLPGSREVLVNRHMHNLAHELFHWRDGEDRGEIDATHEGWESNGRNAASVEYNSRLEWL
jgi:hypothetical protein